MIKLGELMHVDKIFTECSREKLPVKLAFKIFKLLQIIEPNKKFYLGKINSIVSEYGERDSNGRLVVTENSVNLTEDGAEKCQKEIFELENIEVEQPDLLFTLGELEELKFSVSDMAILQKFIKEEL